MNSISLIHPGGNLRGAHVTWNARGRIMLCEVVSTYREDGYLCLRLRHFDGSEAPDMMACLVNVLERTYEPEETP